MKIETYRTYRAKIRYHRTDDLKPDALPDGAEVLVKAMWIAEPDERFAGDWIFLPVDGIYNLPARDLEIIGPEESATFKRN